MKTSGIIAEYNPFHLGHKYQIDKIKKELNTNIISIMSGDFVQRGECTILDKYTRAKIAINNGVDLVIELPFFQFTKCRKFCKRWNIYSKQTKYHWLSLFWFWM